jgi:3-oxoacyl-[acyl-carrier-protein] synthase III
MRSYTVEDFHAARAAAARRRGDGAGGRVPATGRVEERETAKPSLGGAAIASVAMTVPERVVANAEIADRIGVSDDWILARTGVRERRFARAGERLVDLATAAGRSALEGAGIEAGDLDLVLVATVAPDDLMPNAAPLVAQELGARTAAAVDVGAACTGFLSALALAAGQVEGDRVERVLVVGADVLSRFVDLDDRATAGLFADGAGAAVVGPAGKARGRIGPIVLHADGSGGGCIRATHAERLIRMQGHDTFREAVRRLSEATLEAADRARLGLEDVDLFVYHQANTRILAAVAERLGLDRERVIDCIDRFGNTSSATLPIALAEAEATGRLAPGDIVLLSAFGAGFTWGAGIVEWGGSR